MIRHALSEVLFFFGRIVCYIMNITIFGYDFGKLYWLYNKLMLASLDIQGEGKGPWGKPE